MRKSTMLSNGTTLTLQRQTTVIKLARSLPRLFECSALSALAQWQMVLFFSMMDAPDGIP